MGCSQGQQRITRGPFSKVAGPSTEQTDRPATQPWESFHRRLVVERDTLTSGVNLYESFVTA